MPLQYDEIEEVKEIAKQAALDVFKAMAVKEPVKKVVVPETKPLVKKPDK